MQDTKLSKDKSPSAFKIVLVRHGESQWNYENRFTGWIDVDLTTRGEAEAGHAGILLKEAGYSFDLVYSSVLERTIKSVFYLLETLGQLWIPQEKCWELNERHYGALQRMSKDEAVAKYGEQQVFRWRRSYRERPPLLDSSSLDQPCLDPRYKDVQPELIRAGESLADTSSRVLRFWDEVLLPQVIAGKKILIVAHGNSIRAIVKKLHQYSDSEIEAVNIPTGVPLVYDINQRAELISHAKLESK